MSEPCSEADHERSKRDDALWAEHEPKGTVSYDFGDEVEHLSYVNCRKCHSTLCRRVTVEAAIAAVDIIPPWLNVLRASGAMS